MIKNKKILVTGGAGFIGSHLTHRLIREGAKISVTVKYNSIIDCPRLVKVWDKINIIESDLRNTDSVSEMKKLQFDYVFHLAAYNHVGDSFKHVLENVNSNLITTINLLNNGPKIKKFIHRYHFYSSLVKPILEAVFRVFFTSSSINVSLLLVAWEFIISRFIGVREGVFPN